MNGDSDSIILILKAAWVLPMDTVAMPNACILIKGKHIEGVVAEGGLGKALNGRRHLAYDYGQAIILPGLINLHTHLEHTNLSGLAQETAFLDWLPKIMQATSKYSFDDRASAAHKGIAEIMASGTTYVVDCSYNGASLKPLAQSGLRAMIGLEIFGVNESAAKDQWQQWLSKHASFLEDETIAKAVKQERLSITAAPHAPYTVCPALWREALEWAQKNDLMLLTHLAESQAEYDWFNLQDEKMKQFLINAFSQRDPGFADLYDCQMRWKGDFLSPVAHLQKQGLLTDNLLAAHAVQVNDHDIALLKLANVSVAHCPRSNSKLQCGWAPLEKLLARKLRIGLGTDGAASSGDLNLLSEARFAQNLHRQHKSSIEFSAQQMIELLTIKAAACLGVDDKLGSLTPGKFADLAVFALPEGESLSKFAANPYEALMSGKFQLKTLMVNGEKL